MPRLIVSEGGEPAEWRVTLVKQPVKPALRVAAIDPEPSAITQISLPQSGRFKRSRQMPGLHRHAATDGRMRLDSALLRANRNSSSDAG